MSAIQPNNGGRASITAVGAAVFRASHLALDDDPKVFTDPFALPFSGAGAELSLYDHASAVLAKFTGKLGPKTGPEIFRYLRALMTMRSRYAEDAFDSAIGRGHSRYLILGAGLDSFAYRRRDLAASVQVFELDRPATQSWKLQRLLELGLQQPSNLAFLPFDLGKETVLKGFRAAGYFLEGPVFLSWLGVTQYLAEVAVFRVLRQVASLAPGSEIVFTYIAPPDTLDDESKRLFAIFAQSTASRGEPWVTFLETAKLTGKLEELGFTHITSLSPEEANSCYFVGRTDGLRVPRLEHLVHARVG
jgi:methyltransferase (TIGR00027 family)